MSFLRLLAAVLVACVAAGAVWWYADRPVPVAAEWSQPLSSVSFAPFRRGESPLTKVYPTPQEVEQDMASIVGRAKGIRTYTSREGLEVVPALAEKYGIKLTLGIWLGSDRAINEQELAAGIKEANDHPDAVQRVIVGNEVLLRGDLPPEELIGYIRRVKAAIHQPVSTADVWAFVLKYPEVGRELDYITVHILPFWDDEPIGLDGVEDYTVKILDRVRQTFPGKPVLIGETGWPSIGRDRGPAVVDVVHEADFVRRMANLGERLGFDYNIVEEFDQPWKSALENTVGAAWGVMEADRVNGKGVPKFAMTGPVTQVADWRIRAGWAITLGAIASLLFARSLPSFTAMLTFAAAAQFLSWLMVSSGFHSHEVTYRTWQYYWLALRIGLPALLFLAILGQARDRLAGLPGRDAWHGRTWMALSAAYAVGWSLFLLFDGRYRDIPEFDFCLPVGGVLALAAINLMRGAGLRAALSLDGLFPGGAPRFARWLGWALVAGAILSCLSEAVALAGGRDFIAAHPSIPAQLPLLLKGLVWNREMDLWSAMQLLWALPFLLVRKPAKRQAPA
jgi:exo-beta-1,3-glucanase (GH17 family)